MTEELPQAITGEAGWNLASPYLFIIADKIRKMSEIALVSMHSYKNFAFAKMWGDMLADLYDIVECNLRAEDRKTELIDEAMKSVLEFEMLGQYPENKGMLKQKYQDVIEKLRISRRDLMMKMQVKKLIMPSEKMTGKELAAMRWIDREAKYT